MSTALDILDYRTLKLDATHRPIGIINWWDAIALSHPDYRDKAMVVSTYGVVVQSAQRAFEIPAVVALKEYHGFHRFKVKWDGRALFKRDDYTCQYCGRQSVGSKLTVDHVVPRAQNGRSTWENTVTSCRPCNEVKADRTPQQAGMRLLHKPRQPLQVGLRRFAGAHVPSQWLSYLG